MSTLRGLAGLALLLAGCAADPTRVDSDPATGYALYRSGWLTRGELAALCREGVRELVVLDGTASRRECAWRDEVCPDLVVRYDREQRADEPLDAAFLDSFDDWIGAAREAGRRVAFRCRHGWHRAGRLTAWYRMRFQGWEADEAAAEMLDVGRWMGRHPYLAPQVAAFASYLEGGPCSAGLGLCVAGSAAERGFAADACSTGSDSLP